MSRKKKAPKKIAVVDPKYKSSVIPKLINSIMYDGKKTIAEKIVYEAIDKIKTKSKDEPINIINEAIKNMTIKCNNSYLVIAKPTMLNNEYKNIKETLFQSLKEIK